MNILYLAHRIPYPPNKGDKLRAFRHLEHLSRRHRVRCACFLDDPGDRAHVDALRTCCEAVAAVPLSPWRAKARGLGGLLAGRTVTESYYRSRAMRGVVDRWSRDVDFDVAVAYSSSMAPYALAARAARRVLDLCDCDSLKWAAYAEFTSGPMRGLYRTEAERLGAFERHCVAVFDATILITPREADGLTTDKSSIDAPRIHIVGNGVDVDHDDIPPAQASTEHSTATAYRVDPGDVGRPPVVGFVGVMDYPPNVDGVRWFARECWPVIRRTCPAAVFRIIGRSPTRAVRRLARLAGVEVVGEVKDVSHALESVDVSVAPLRIARGLQNKALEAMAAGKPVVMTTAVAGGLRGCDREPYVVRDDAPAFARGVSELIADPARRRRMGASARAFVAEHYRWEVELEKLERVVTGIHEDASTLWRSSTEAMSMVHAHRHRPVTGSPSRWRTAPRTES